MNDLLYRIDKDMDRLLARQLRQLRNTMRRDGVPSEDVRSFCRDRIDVFREVKEFALPAIVAAAAGHGVPKSWLN